MASTYHSYPLLASCLPSDRALQLCVCLRPIGYWEPHDLLALDDTTAMTPSFRGPEPVLGRHLLANHQPQSPE